MTPTTDPPPRIAPGSRADIGLVNSVIARVIGAASGGRPPHVFTTLARHRRLFRHWLRFASALMPRGVLPRDETELLILRVAHHCDSAYEWQQHERIARTAGLSPEEVERVRHRDQDSQWSPRRALLLAAADELHANRVISGQTWSRLSELLSDVELIELCMLVGHYEMLAMTLNSLGVQLDPVSAGRPSPAMMLLRRMAARRRPAGGGSS